MKKKQQKKNKIKKTPKNKTKRKSVIFSNKWVLTYVLGAQKNRLIELLSTMRRFLWVPTAYVLVEKYQKSNF